MTAYKFLRAGRVAPFSAYTWPVGTWVEAETDPCVSGIHACTAEDLPYWLNSELWEIELVSPMRHDRKLVAPRGRLTARVDSWSAATQQDFWHMCEARARELSASGRAGAHSGDFTLAWVRQSAAAAGFVAARVAELAGGPIAYAAERRRQADWLADRLGLASSTGPGS